MKKYLLIVPFLLAMGVFSSVFGQSESQTQRIPSTEQVEKRIADAKILATPAYVIAKASFKRANPNATLEERKTFIREYISNNQPN